MIQVGRNFKPRNSEMISFREIYNAYMLQYLSFEVSPTDILDLQQIEKSACRACEDQFISKDKIVVDPTDQEIYHIYCFEKHLNKQNLNELSHLNSTVKAKIVELKRRAEDYAFRWKRKDLAEGIYKEFFIEAKLAKELKEAEEREINNVVVMEPVEEVRVEEVGVFHRPKFEVTFPPPILTIKEEETKIKVSPSQVATGRMDDEEVESRTKQIKTIKKRTLEQPNNINVIPPTTQISLNKKDQKLEREGSFELDI